MSNQTQKCDLQRGLIGPMTLKKIDKQRLLSLVEQLYNSNDNFYLNEHSDNHHNETLMDKKQ